MIQFKKILVLGLFVIGGPLLFLLVVNGSDNTTKQLLNEDFVVSQSNSTPKPISDVVVIKHQVENDIKLEISDVLVEVFGLPADSINTNVAIQLRDKKEYQFYSSHKFLTTYSYDVVLGFAILIDKSNISLGDETISNIKELIENKYPVFKTNVSVTNSAFD